MRYAAVFANTGDRISGTLRFSSTGSLLFIEITSSNKLICKTYVSTPTSFHPAFPAPAIPSEGKTRCASTTMRCVPKKEASRVPSTSRDGDRVARTMRVRSICQRRVNRRKMRTSAVLLLFACDFLAGGIANGKFHEQHRVEEDSRNVDFDLLPSPPDHAYAAYGENRRNVEDDALEHWKGRWMPDRPADPTPPPKVFPNGGQPVRISQYLHEVPMGRSSADCDDAKTNLTVDWDGTPIGYTCYSRRIVPDRNAAALEYCERIPKYYVATHKCMSERIEYDDNVPLFGPHRPLWPVYGEYKYLPKQRWLHSLEHGGIVGLYHPCANPQQVKRFKSLITGCLRRHVISPYDMLDEHRPLVLVAWGCRLSMSYLNPALAIRFVRKHALRGPEEISRDGDFDDGLLQRAKIVTSVDDDILCPNARTV